MARLRKKAVVETEPEVAELVRLYCFLRGVTVKSFATEVLGKAVAPYRSWIDSFRKLREQL